MKHIDTTSAEEKQARKEYAEVKPGLPVVADEKTEATVRELLALRHRIDEEELQASKLKAELMNAMGGAALMKSKDGTRLVSWGVGATKKVVDYKALLAKYNVTDEDVAAHTTQKTGSRVFSIELD